ncbi:MAG: protein CapI [Chloroflexi bacterium]|nr:protein CapI [Chloroflexota bacterium]|tara:strand:+ start:1061 stop:2071 length:1011 start_codon:yes stop_codon:yes gene_type:complete
MKFLLTGSAGFIGFHTAMRLCELGYDVIGIDNLSDYYSVKLKKDRLSILENYRNYQFKLMDIIDTDKLTQIMKEGAIDRVIHLAAQPGVRYSIDHPYIYGQSNLVGHLSVLEACRSIDVDHLVYASSSSIYGFQDYEVLSESSSTDHPVSLYAATKKSNELMSHAYSHLYNIPCTGLRFFTVYGPWGRPDMALFKFTRSIINGDPIKINNNGDMLRDFTYIDDIVEGIVRIQEILPKKSSVSSDNELDPSCSKIAPYSIYNIGNGRPVSLLDFISTLERHLSIKAKKEFQPMQPGDVLTTHADTERLFEVTKYRPKITIEEGVKNFVNWYRDYYSI